MLYKRKAHSPNTSKILSVKYIRILLAQVSDMDSHSDFINLLNDPV